MSSTTSTNPVKKTVEHFIGGKADAGKRGRARARSTIRRAGEETGRVQFADRADVDAAVASAPAALSRVGRDDPVAPRAHPLQL